MIVKDSGPEVGGRGLIDRFRLAGLRSLTAAERALAMTPTWEDQLIALADQAPDLHGPELERRAALLVDMGGPGAWDALEDLVEAVQILNDMDGYYANADLHSDHPACAAGEWDRHLADALRRLNPNGDA